MGSNLYLTLDGYFNNKNAADFTADFGCSTKLMNDEKEKKT